MTKDIRERLWDRQFDGDDVMIPDECEAREPLTVADLKAAVAEIDRLRAQVERLQKQCDMRDTDRLFASRSLLFYKTAHRIVLGVDPPKIWQHIKRGSLYVEVGTATVQLSTDQPITEGDKLVIYRGEAGALWARRESEFHDGRFIEPTAETLEEVRNAGK